MLETTVIKYGPVMRLMMPNMTPKKKLRAEAYAAWQNRLTTHWNHLLLVVVVVSVDTVGMGNAALGRSMTQRSWGRVIVVSDAQQVVHLHHRLEAKLPSSVTISILRASSKKSRGSVIISTYLEYIVHLWEKEATMCTFCRRAYSQTYPILQGHHSDLRTSA